MTRSLIITVSLVLIFSTLGMAEESANAAKLSDKPIEVNSRKMTARMVPGGAELVFDGKVKIKQEDMLLTCDRLVVVYEDEKKGKSDPEVVKKSSKDISGSVKNAVATGNVKVTKGELTAVAGKAVLDNQKRTVLLNEGPPKVWQGPHMLTAPTIIIYLDENRAELMGGEDNGGIKATLNPGKAKKEK